MKKDSLCNTFLPAAPSSSASSSLGQGSLFLPQASGALACNDSLDHPPHHHLHRRNNGHKLHKHPRVDSVWMIVVTLLLAVMSSCSANANQNILSMPKSTASPGPSFLEPMHNQTVAVGREAVFQCILGNLKGHQVAWFHKDRHTLLALQDKVITKNSRIRVSSQASSAFYLHISDVREEDAGFYSCQVNSSPMKSQSGHLEVVVPARFVEHLTSPSHVDVVEDSLVASLRCVANGSPSPEIKWRREDGQPINIQSGKKERVTVVSGEFFNLTKVQRTDSGAYICIASNGIPPATSKRIFLGVTFSPMIWTSRQVVSAPLGGDAVLHCILESYPPAVTYWSKANGPQIIVSNNSKYEALVTSVPNVLYKSDLRLRIRNVQSFDLTSYMCVAKNALGETRGTIRLIQDTTASSSSSSSSSPSSSSSSSSSSSASIGGQQESQQVSNTINYYTGASAKSNHKKDWPGKSNTTTTVDTSLASLPSSSSFPSSFPSSSHSHGCSYVPLSSSSLLAFLVPLSLLCPLFLFSPFHE